MAFDLSPTSGENLFHLQLEFPVCKDVIRRRKSFTFVLPLSRANQLNLQSCLTESPMSYHDSL